MRLVFACLAVCLAGCSSPAYTPSASGRIPAYQQSPRLYLKEAPYPRLLLHVSAVEGLEPTDELLRALTQFLETHCAKPEGIAVRRGAAIASEVAEGLTLPELTIAATSGIAPVPSDTAVLHVLFFDSDGLRLPQGDSEMPHVLFYSPTTLFIDMAAFPDDLGEDLTEGVLRLVLCHEAGHALGLTQREDEGDGAHCLRDDCLMVAVPDLSTLEVVGAFLFDCFPERELCTKCVEELSGRRASPSAGERFRLQGPVLTRRERGYTVYALPFFICIALANPEPDPSTQQLLDWARAGAARLRPRSLAAFKMIGVDTSDSGAVRGAAELLARDPEHLVQRVAAQLRERAEAKASAGE